MFNTYINNRLNDWARWLLMRSDGGQGYPGQSAFVRLAGGTKPGAYIPPGLDEDAWEVEQAVQSLKPELKLVVQAFYCHTGTVEQKAKECHCHRDTMYARLDRAHGLIMDYLNGCTCGEYAAVPVGEYRPSLEKIA